MKQLFDDTLTKDNTKRIRVAYERYKNQPLRALWNVYDKPSAAKARAWEYCKNLMSEVDGRNISVVSYNNNVFSAGFMAEKDGRDVFVYITPTRDSYMEV